MAKHPPDTDLKPAEATRTRIFGIFGPDKRLSGSSRSCTGDGGEGKNALKGSKCHDTVRPPIRLLLIASDRQTRTRKEDFALGVCFHGITGWSSCPELLGTISNRALVPDSAPAAELGVMSRHPSIELILSPQPNSFMSVTLFVSCGFRER